MTQANISKLKEYADINVQTGVESATPHRLILMLMQGALDKISIANGFLRENMNKEKGESISTAISIIGGLRDSLDHDAGGDIAANLESLYEYMTFRLMEANLHNDASILDEVHKLLSEIKGAWQAIEQHPEVTALNQVKQNAAA